MPENMSGAYPHTYQRALYMRLREHHCIDSLPAGFGQYQYDSEAEGLGAAFFPPNFHFSEGNVSVNFVDCWGPPICLGGGQMAGLPVRAGRRPRRLAGANETRRTARRPEMTRSHRLVAFPSARYCLSFILTDRSFGQALADNPLFI